MNTTFNDEPKPKYWNNMQPPDFESLILKNEKFTDPYFPPDNTSLFSIDSSNNYTDPVRGQQNEAKLKEFFGESQIVWHRLSEIQPEWTLFGREITSDQINQGFLGNCYYLSLLASLANYPSVIHHIFKTINYNINGYYEVQLFIDGEWQCIFVDDYFPFIEVVQEKKNPLKIEGHFVFAKPKVNEIWVMILEKVWAKINKGYSNIRGGTMLDAIHILTGFTGSTLKNSKLTSRDSEINSGDIYNKLEKELQSNSIINAGTINDKSIEEKKLVSSHSYSILEAAKIEEAKSNIYLLKMRNPSGTNEFLGDWGSINQKSIGDYKTYNESSKDGTFWIDIDSYMKYFDFSCITRLLFNSVCRYYIFNDKKYFKYPLVFNFTLQENSTVNFNLIFTDFKLRKTNPDLIIPSFFVLSSWDTKTNLLKEVYSKYELKQNLNFTENLEAGNYILWLYIPLKESESLKPEDFKFALLVSSEKEFKLKLVSIDKKNELISRIALDKSKMAPPVEETTKKKDTKAPANSNSGNTEVGIDSDNNNINGLFTVFIENKTKDRWAQIKAKFTLKKAVLMVPYKGQTEITLDIPPNKTNTLLAYYSEPGEISLTVEMESTLEKRRVVIPQDNILEIREEFFKFNQIQSDKYKDKAPLFADFVYVAPDIKPKKDKNNPEGKEVIPSPIPNIKKNNAYKYKGKEAIIQKIFFSLDMPNFKPLFITMFPKEMNILLNKYKVFTLTEAEEYWTYHENNDGIYIIVYTFQTERGIFLKRTKEKNKDGSTYIKYIGNLKDGKLHGKGEVMDHYYKTIYEGYFENGKKSGFGVLYLDNGEIYEGNFKNDLFNGKGKYIYKNGSYWEGNFLNGEKNGVGKTVENRPILKSDKNKATKSSGKSSKESQDVTNIINKSNNSVGNNSNFKTGNVSSEIKEAIKAA